MKDTSHSNSPSPINHDDFIAHCNNIAQDLSADIDSLCSQASKIQSRSSYICENLPRLIDDFLDNRISPLSFGWQLHSFVNDLTELRSLSSDLSAACSAFRDSLNANPK